MAGQRRGESGSHALRRSRRGRGGGLAALLLVSAAIATLGACDAGTRIIGYGTTGGGGSGSGGGGGTGGSSLTGTWRNLSSLMLSTGGTLVLDVRWSFDGAKSCSRTRIQTIISGNGGTETTETLSCTYTISGSTVTVSFQGSSVPSRFSIAFVNGDLLLAGTRFTRIG